MRHYGRLAGGMSLVELLTVISVVAILSSIAVASYRQYIRRANRTDATTALLSIQAAEEKWFLQNNTYTSNLTNAPPTGLGFATTTTNGYYNLTLVATATTYTVTATATGGQASDTTCPTFTIDDQGVRGPTATASTCWR